MHNSSCLSKSVVEFASSSSFLYDASGYTILKFASEPSRYDQKNELANQNGKHERRIPRQSEYMHSKIIIELEKCGQYQHT